MRFYVVTRDVSAGEEHNFLHRDVRAGEVLGKFTGVTWGAVDYDAGVAVREKLDGPFFEFPRDAVREEES